MLLDHPIISRRVFHPRSTDLEPDLVVNVGDVQLGCHVRRRHPDAGWLLYIHGNGELASEYITAGYAEVFLDLGVNVCFAEYRGYGLSTGTPALVAMKRDGEAIVRALGADPAHVVAFGRSLGSLYAAELAAQLPGLAGIVIESGIADIPDCWSFHQEAVELGVEREELMREVATEFNQREKLGGYRGGLLVMHTTHDHLVDRSHADRLASWSGGSDKKLVMFSQGDHNSIFRANAIEYLKELGEFLMRVGVANRREP